MERIPPPKVLLEDRDLMVLVGRGDGKAFDLLVERHRDRIVNFLYRLVGNVAEAEDLAQDTFLRVYRSRKTYQPLAKFSTWLYRIAHNTALSHLRARVQRSKIEPASIASNDIGPEARLTTKETVREILVALEQLPHNQRTALVLTQLEDHSYTEAAEVLNVSVAAVRSLVSRARDALRQRLRRTLAEMAAGKEA